LPVHTSPDLSDSGARPRDGGTGSVRLAVVVGVVLLALGGAIGVWRWLDVDRTSGDRGVAAVPTATGTATAPRAFTCGIPDSQPDRDYCRRAAADFARRAPLSDEQRRRAEGIAAAVWGAAASGGWCMPTPGPACLKRPPPHAPGPADVDAARLWLARTGASDISARLARPDDPAPSGSLLFAVRVDDACIIGHVDAIPEGGGAHGVGGLLPDGRCLAG
jgi:hypothetical protein